jgi:hypothetical protein
MEMNAQSLPLIFAAFLLASFGWSLGKMGAKWLRRAPGRWERAGYPWLRRVAFCRMSRHRETHSYRTKNNEQRDKALWWIRKTSCTDCHKELRSLEVFKEEVPACERTGFITFSFASPFFGYGGEPPVEGDEWKSGNDD